MIDRLVAAIDGSEAAKRSLDTMINLAKAMTTQPDIVLVSVKVPMPPLTGMGVVVSEDLLDAYYEKAQQETLAAAVIAALPVIVLFAFLERHLVSAITAGAVKG